ncbi:MAG: hypothetical protein GF421_13325 [Candidatus Aminicenantes bacterium]|nr:hypothetical protein [Candidatus Aminicenantes bacterium]
MDKMAILFNPSSGRGLSLKKEDRIKALLKQNSIPFQWFCSRSENHFRQLAQEKARSFQVILVVGGDTSFQIAASEIHKSPYQPTLYLMPTGSANDIAMSLGIHSVDSTIQSLLESKTRQMDLGLLEIKGRSEKIYFVGSLSLGLGATINQFVAHYWKQHPLRAKYGKLIQVWAGFLGARHSFQHQNIPMKIQLSSDDSTHNIESSIVVFSNVPCYAGGLRVCPWASPFDGKLDCSIIHTTSFMHTARFAYSVWRQKHKHKKEIRYLQNKSFSVSSQEPINIQYDGQIIPGIRDFQASILPSALNILE